MAAPRGRGCARRHRWPPRAGPTPRAASVPSPRTGARAAPRPVRCNSRGFLPRRRGTAAWPDSRPPGGAARPRSAARSPPPCSRPSEQDRDALTGGREPERPVPLLVGGGEEAVELVVVVVRVVVEGGQRGDLGRLGQRHRLGDRAVAPADVGRVLLVAV